MRFVYLLLIIFIAFTFVHAQELEWEICGPGTLEILNIRARPDPPQSGAKFYFEVKGVLKQPIESGTAGIVVLYDGVEIYKADNINVCEFMNLIRCPVKPGPLVIAKEVEIPDFAPVGGPYEGTITMQDQSKRQIICLKFRFMMDPPDMAKG